MVETIKIPERFREPLKRRFDPEMIQKTVLGKLHLEGYILATVCPLCEVYQRNDNCDTCPFGLKPAGCIPWMREILGLGNIGGDPFSAIESKDELKRRIYLIKEKAEEYIEWV